MVAKVLFCDVPVEMRNFFFSTNTSRFSSFGVPRGVLPVKVLHAFCFNDLSSPPFLGLAFIVFPPPDVS